MIYTPVDNIDAMCEPEKSSKMALAGFVSTSQASIISRVLEMMIDADCESRGSQMLENVA